MIITNYLTREIFRPFLMVCGVLLLLMISYSALTMLSDLEAQLIDEQLLWLLIITKTIAAFELFLPLALYITLLMGLGKLYAEQEIISLQASGMSIIDIIKLLMPLILFVTVITAIVANFARPWAYDLKYEAKSEAGKMVDFERLQAGSFYVNEETNTVYFAKAIDEDDNTKHEVFLYKAYKDRIEVISAAQAEQISHADARHSEILFSDGTASVIASNASDVLIDFNTMLVKSKNDATSARKYKRKAASTAFLSSATSPADIAEFQWRMTAPIKTALLAILAILLAKTSSRQGRYGKLLFGISLFFAIHGLSIVAKTWVEQGVMITSPGMWSVVILLILMNTILRLKEY